MVSLSRLFLAAAALTCGALAADAEKPDGVKVPAVGAPEAKAPAAPQAVRLKFVPVKKNTPNNEGSGTSLTQKGIDPTAMSAMMHLGLEDSFPVHDEQGHTFFEIELTGGDDQHVVLAIHAKEGVQKIAAVRDVATEFTVGGLKYDVTFPTSHVGPDSPAITHQAFLIVAQRP